jgi:hypothetical protein
MDMQTISPQSGIQRISAGSNSKTHPIGRHYCLDLTISPPEMYVDYVDAEN